MNFGWMEDLYRTYRQSLYAFFWSRTGSREDAMDLVQDVFIRAWRHATALGDMPESRRGYWLFACARTVSIDHHRHRHIAWKAELRHGTEEAARFAGDPVDLAEAAEDWRDLDRAIRALPEPLRDVLSLRVLGELTSRQISEVLGVPPGTVRYRLARARAELWRHRPSVGGDGEL